MNVRPRGYYWVKFNYKKWGGGDRPPHWEVGSWDPDSAGHAGAWALIGARDLWLDFQIEEIGPMIGEPDE